MKVRQILAASAIALATFGVSAANAENTLNIQYFDIGNPGSNVSSGTHTDFGICCSTSDGATIEGNLIGTNLSGGLPVVGAGSTVVDTSGSGQILWWTPGTVDDEGGVGPYAIAATGSGVITLPYASNMFAPNSTGSTDDNLYETAILSGNLIDNGVDAQITVSADDDALVYVNGQYVGGTPGVHGTETALIDLGAFNGTESIDVFYADRAHVGANLALDVSGATTSAVPEPAAWAMMLLGFGGIGWTLRSRRNAAIATA